MKVEIKKVWAGRMGNDLRPAWETYIDGVIVGGSPRKWIAVAIGNAIEAGQIGADGDTEMALIKWARDNDPALLTRFLNLSGV